MTDKIPREEMQTATIVFSEEEARMVKLILRTAGEADSSLTEWARSTPVEMDAEGVLDSVSPELRDMPEPAELLRLFGPNDRRWGGTIVDYVALNTAFTTWLHKESDRGTLSDHFDTQVGIMNKIRAGTSEITGEDMGTIEESMEELLDE